MIQIFNIQLNGKDADAFCQKSATDKFAWIQKRVPSATEQQIDEFLSKELKHSKAGCGCSSVKEKTTTNAPVKTKQANKKKNVGNISKGVQGQASADTEAVGD